MTNQVIAVVEKNSGGRYATLGVAPGLSLLKIAGQATGPVSLRRFACSHRQCSSRNVYGFRDFLGVWDVR